MKNLQGILGVFLAIVVVFCPLLCDAEKKNNYDHDENESLALKKWSEEEHLLLGQQRLEEIPSIEEFHHEQARRKLLYYYDCGNLIKNGDAENGSLLNWSIKGAMTGSLKVGQEIRNTNQTKHFVHEGRTDKSSGPGQSLNMVCLEYKKQYKVSGLMKIEDEQGESPFVCDKESLWGDSSYCPIVTIQAQTATGLAWYNIGNSLNPESGWYQYNAVFTVDDILSSSSGATIYLRGPRPGVKILWDDFRVEEYLGEDTDSNYWVGLSTQTEAEGNVVPLTEEGSGEEESSTESTSSSYSYTEPDQDTVYVYEHFGRDTYPEATGPCTQLVKNGNAEWANLTSWKILGSTGGKLDMHNKGPIGETKSFKHVNRLSSNSGPGQLTDVSCYEPDTLFEFKAKIKLVDENGFPYSCSVDAPPGSDLACPLFTIETTAFNGVNNFRSFSNMMQKSWVPNAFNEYWTLFVPEEGATSVSWFIRGPRAGADVLFDDVSIMKKTYDAGDYDSSSSTSSGSSSTTTTSSTSTTTTTTTTTTSSSSTVDSEVTPESIYTVHDIVSLQNSSQCSQLIWNNSTWEIKGVQSGELNKNEDSYLHSDRSHVSSGPGIDLDSSCFLEGRQFLLTAYIKLIDGKSNSTIVNVDYDADWLDPDYPPLFTIVTMLPTGEAKYNLGFSSTARSAPLLDDGYNLYRAVFTVDEILANVSSAYLYVRGPSSEIDIMIKEASLSEYVGDDTNNNFWTAAPEPEGTSPLEGVLTTKLESLITPLSDLITLAKSSENEEYLFMTDMYEGDNSPDAEAACTQLILNGDAESNSTEHWDVFNGGEIKIHPHGPKNSTYSFKHMLRSSQQSGPKQALAVDCLREGLHFEVKAKLKLTDENGFPYECTSALFNHHLSCPLFSIMYALPGNDDVMWLDIPSEKSLDPWVAEDFNEYQGRFKVTPDLSFAVNASLVLRGPRVGARILFDDVYLVPFIFTEAPLDQTLGHALEEESAATELISNEELANVTAPTCWEMIKAGSAENYSVEALKKWTPFLGGVIMHHKGPDKNSWKHLYRNSLNGGPSQTLSKDCLVEGRQYKFSALFRTVGLDGPYACNSWEPSDPGCCPTFSLRLTNENDGVSWLYVYNTAFDIKDTISGWNNYTSIFTVTEEIIKAKAVDFVLHGPPEDVVIFFDDMSLVPFGHEDVPDLAASPYVDNTDPTCSGGCCQMAQNGDAEHEDTSGWDAINGGSIMLHPFGPFPDTMSYKHINRVDANSGPGRSLKTACFEPGKKYLFTAMLKLSNADGDYSCTTNNWGLNGTCPLLSIRYRQVSTGNTKWLNVYNAIPHDGFEPSIFNPYEALFTIPDDYVDIMDAFFMIRGPPGNTIIYFDDVSIIPYHHNPNITLDDEICDNICCDLITNGDADDRNMTHWTGGTYEIFGDGTTRSFKMLNRPGIWDGPMQFINTGCLEAGETWKFEATLKIAYPNGEPYKCTSTKWADPEICPFFSIKYITAEGQTKWINAQNFNPTSAWKADAMNPYLTTFKVPNDMTSAQRAYFVLRGLPKDHIVIFDNVSLTPYDHTPGVTERALTFYKDIDQTIKELAEAKPDNYTDLSCELRITETFKLICGENNCECSGGNCTDGTSWFTTETTEEETTITTYKKTANETLEHSSYTLSGWYQNFCTLDHCVCEHGNCTNGIHWWSITHNTTSYKREEEIIEDVETVKNKLVVTKNETIPPDVYNFDPKLLYTRQVECIGECCDLIFNGDANSLNKLQLKPWIASQGGKLGWDWSLNGTYSFKHSYRTRVSSGMAQKLNTACIQPGNKFEMRFIYKLLDANDQPYACQNNKWGDALTCPHVHILYRNIHGKRQYARAQNKATGNRTASYNLYETSIVLPDNMKKMSDSYVYIYGPPAGVSVLVDDVGAWVNDTEKQYFFADAPTVSPQTYDGCEGECCDILRNGDAESGHTKYWFGHGGGQIVLNPFGPEGSDRSFKHVNRPWFTAGPAQRFSNECFRNGRRFEIEAKIQLKDATGLPYACKTDAPLDRESCPYLIIRYYSTDKKWKWIWLFNGNTEPYTDGFNTFKAGVNIPSDVKSWKGSNFFFWQGPPGGHEIIFDDVKLDITGTQSDPTPSPTAVPDDLENSPSITNEFVTPAPTPLHGVCIGVCCQLIAGISDPESGDVTAWHAYGQGSIVIVPYGPGEETHSYKHVGRLWHNNGPGQDLTPVCLKPGERYYFKAWIQTEFNNGEPYKCTTTQWNHQYTCPLWSIMYTSSENGQRKWFNPREKIDLKRPKIAGFNLYETYFRMPTDMVVGESTYFIIRGPPGGNHIAWNGLSLIPVGHNPTNPTNETENAYPELDFELNEPDDTPIDNVTTPFHHDNCVGGCCGLVLNGDLEDSNKTGWFGISGGIVQLHDWGGGGSTKSIKHIQRPHVNSGPGQNLTNTCFQAGKKLTFTAQIRTADYRGAAYRCNTDSWNEKGTCPLFSIRYTDKSGKRRWINGNRKEGSSVHTTGFDLYQTSVLIPDDIAACSNPVFVVRGPPMENLIFLDNVNIFVNDTEPLDSNTCHRESSIENLSASQSPTKAPAIASEPIESPTEEVSESFTSEISLMSADAYLDCVGCCCECVVDGDADDGEITSWTAYGGGEIEFHDPGPVGTEKSYKHVQRPDINSGPGQPLTSLCFTSHGTFQVSAMIKLANEEQDNQDYACNTVVWAQDLTCPLFTLSYVSSINGARKLFNIYNQAQQKQIPGFNLYNATFEVPEDFASGQHAYFFVRGPPANRTIIFDDFILTPIGHNPHDEAFTGLMGADLLDSDSSPTPSVLSATAMAPTVARNFTSVGCEMYYDFEDKVLGAWHSNLGGADPIFVSPGANESSTSLEVNNRVLPGQGPKHPLDINCLVLSRTYEIDVLIKMIDESTGAGFKCNILDCNDDSDCPILTVHYKGPGNTNGWMYLPNDMALEWVADDFNKFHTFLHVSEELADATEVYLYFERPRTGINILIDNFKITEYQPVPDLNILDDGGVIMSPTCDNLIINGNAEAGSTLGWKPRMGGQVSIAPGGADLTQYSFEHNGRNSFIMGPMHELAAGCFIGGMRYIFDAKVKLLDENRSPFTCDKTEKWVDEEACPLLTFEIQTEDDKKWYYFRNEDTSDWIGETWNRFHVLFDATEGFTKSIDGSFFIERPKAGLSIMFDEVTLSRDCVTLIHNFDGETNSTAGWSILENGSGEIKIYNQGYGVSTKSFGMFGRVSSNDGLGHLLDVACFVVGRTYKFTAYMKLLDELQGNSATSCMKDAAMGQYDGCPTLTLHFILSNGSKRVLILNNADTSEWVTTSFNSYTATFEIDDEMASAVGAYLIIKGARAGVAILCDMVKIEVVEELICNDLVTNGHFDDGNLTSWTALGSSLELHSGGVFGSKYALAVTQRSSPESGVMHNIPASCFVEGKEYEFKAFIRLYDVNGEEFICEKAAKYGDPKACPVVGIHYKAYGGTKMIHIQNYDWNIWGAGNWNWYYSIFTVTRELNFAEETYFVVKGCAPGIKVVIDSITLERHISQSDILAYTHRTNICQQMIHDPDALYGDLLMWSVLGSGSVDIVNEENSNYFIHSGRAHHWNGFMMTLETNCFLKEGMRFDFNAMIKLLDSDGNAFACNKTAPLVDSKSCPLLSFTVAVDGGMQQIDFANQIEKEWVSDEWNHFSVIFEVTQEMSNATSMFLTVHGPAGGIDVLFDNVTLKPFNCHDRYDGDGRALATNQRCS